MLPDFAYTTTCQFPYEGDESQTVTLENAFDSLPTLSSAVLVTHAGDGSDRLFVVQQSGQIRVFDNDPSASSLTTFLDISSGFGLESGGEKGLLGLAFHPDYQNNGKFYVNYTERAGSLYTVVSEFQVSAGDPDVADAGSEREVLRFLQDFGNHNGGNLAFGPDGYLYIGTGDGGSGGDPNERAQDLGSLLGKMLRIDVDDTQGGAYGIPSGNPFVADGSALDEIWAYGFRNPWRYTFDAEGTLWLGDVGQNTWEEIDVVIEGGNYGWDCFEGFETYEGGCNGPTIDPLDVYATDGSGAVTGGYVYRGTRASSLSGMYIYADYVQRTVWAYDPSVGDSVELLTSPGNVSSFGEDEAGELYVVDRANGELLHFTEVTVPANPVTLPATLTDTGCFDDLDTLDPAQGVLRYQLNTPLWSDGADKKRWFVLPNGGQIDFAETGKWSFPDGTIFIKHFDLETDSGTVKLETRFTVTGADGLRGYTYRWRADESEADLLDGSETRALTLPGGAAYTWTFPSRTQCNQCHTVATGGVLGLETGQLNRDGWYDGFVAPQLETLQTYDLFSAALPQPADQLPAFPSPDDNTATVEARARAYLHANCAQCHLPNGPTPRDLDLRVTTPLADMNACDTDPAGPNLGIANAKIIKPGDPDASILLQRDLSPSLRMPPLATELIDTTGSDVTRQWIQGLQTCP